MAAVKWPDRHNLGITSRHILTSIYWYTYIRDNICKNLTDYGNFNVIHFIISFIQMYNHKLNASLSMAVINRSIGNCMASQIFALQKRPCNRLYPKKCLECIGTTISWLNEAKSQIFQSAASF